ncbi:MAG: ABC transporter ATP-binding protein [Desulfobacterales bacterium]|nr:ABC transporter ATP-binding protein [Desulfobacterales bacterium]
MRVNNGAVIQVRSLYKKFNAGTLAVLDNVSFSLEDGESMAVIGPSGCGKTTLLYILAGLISYARGTVMIKGDPLKGPLRNTAFILQDFGLLPWKTVRQNVCLGMKLRGVSKEKERIICDSLLETMGLSQYRDCYPARLSGGEKQRIAIARALALKPDILLMDEPFSSLDTFTTETLQDTLLEIKAVHHLTMIIVTHSIEEAVFLGDKIMVMSQRPAHVKAIVPNSQAGYSSYRSDEMFFAACRKVRKVVEQP